MAQDSDHVQSNEIEAAQTPKISEDTVYINGFGISYGNSDVILTCQRNGQNVLTLNMSFTLAKTLSQMTGTTVQNIEAVTGMDIKTTKEIDEALRKHIKAQTGETH